MSTKPIEPGCFAVSTGHVNSVENRYKTVRVLYDATSEHDDPPDKVWCVEGDVFSKALGHGKADFFDKDLMRIDGGDPDAVQEESQDQEVDCHAHA
ncbi:hypothetical protein [Vreelandella profundi]|uniref:hypothetical protein n=1 Tax=Vreelandella profundi TaxID=2852117 RepID=UPI001F30D51E|nr:hypothetical protein [Halomonas profundi]